MGNLKIEINLIGEQVNDDEIVEGVATLIRGIGGLKQ